ncbi:MAG: 50S ribosomal protein L20 [Candidatus Omnitrophota bacterium]
MVRIKNAVARRKRKKGLMKDAKGQFGHRSRRFVQAVRSVLKGWSYAYRDRKVKKREFRALWIVRINAACREAGMSYSRFINGLKKADVGINRKMLAELAVADPAAFQQLVETAKKAVEQPAAKT